MRANMKKRVAACVIGITAMMTALPAQADLVDGQTLFEWAKEYERVRAGTGDYLSHIYDRRFQVYVAGVHDAHVGARQSSTDDRLFCSPGGATVNQVSVAVYRFLRKNPEMSFESGSVLVISALVEAFPCPGQ